MQMSRCSVGLSPGFGSEAPLGPRCKNTFDCFPHRSLTTYHPTLSELPSQQLSQRYFSAQDRNVQIPLNN